MSIKKPKNHKNPWIRSEKSKQKLLRIIKKAKILFYEQGAAFKMRELARRLGVGISYLYRYVESKRELWFAVVYQEYSDLTKRFQHIKENYKGSGLKLLENIFTEFINFSQEEFPRFNLMFLMQPPTSNKSKGPFEEWQDPQFSLLLFSIFDQALSDLKISIKNHRLIAYSIWSMILGFATQNSPIYDYFIDVDPFPVENKAFKEFILNLISTIIKSNELKLEMDDNYNKK
ncbi:MAG: TetR/AcrR family transcriptional regulator [Candidatus Hermodarchaeota archaeon]